MASLRWKDVRYLGEGVTCAVCYSTDDGRIMGFVEAEGDAISATVNATKLDRQYVDITYAKSAVETAILDAVIGDAP